MRLSSLVTVVALLVWTPASQATAPPNLLEALAAQQALASQHPNDPEILNDLGNLLVLAGTLDAAQEAYRGSLEINPDNTTTRYNLALVLIEQGRTKQATNELHQVLELDPYHAWSYYQLGTLSASAGRRSQAVDFYTRALALRPALASPAINPHIIENRYLTESQLRLYIAKTEATQAPRLYERPGDVAELLLPTSEPDPTTPPLEEQATDPESTLEDLSVTRPYEPAGQVDRDGAGTEGTQIREVRPTPNREPEEASPFGRSEAAAEGILGQTEQDDVGGSDRVLTEEDLVPTTVGQGAGSVGSSGQPSSTRSSGRAGGTVSYPRTTTPKSGSASSTTQGSDSFAPTVESTGRLDLELLIEDNSPDFAPGP